MRFFIKTFGCQMNAHDTERITGILRAAGHEPVDSPAKADVALVNSCSIREKPWHKAISETGRLRKPKRSGGAGPSLVGLVGCVAQQEGENVFDLLSGVDFVVSPDHYQQLPDIIDAVSRNDAHVCLTGFDAGRPEDFLPVSDTGPAPVSAMVTISKGCQEHCHYCIVPHVRGPLRHRPADDIVAEVASLVDRGAREVTLLGQKVNAYPDFPDLLRRLDAVEGLARLRFTSPHPRHMSEALCALYGELRTLCGFIHLPVQSGSDAVLRAMGRRYTRAEYLETVARLRAARPDMVISTDIIVGYPGETEADFEQTLSLLDEADITSAFSFKFSPRPHTRAAAVPDDVPDEVKSARLARLHAHIAGKEAALRASLTGTTQQVLVTSTGRNAGQWSGRADNFQIVNFAAPDRVVAPGDLVPVRITAVHPHSLEGVARE